MIRLLKYVTTTGFTVKDNTIKSIIKIILFVALAIINYLTLTAIAIAIAKELPQGNKFDRLNSELSPLGAQRSGNNEGTIPSWQGGLTTPPKNWNPKQGYIDPFADDPILFTITKDTIEPYRANLSDGIVALLESSKKFEVPVYKSRRTFALPEKVYQATAKNAGRAFIEGSGLKSQIQPGIPFPIPTTGQEVIFNHLNNWIGGYKGCTDWFPIYPNGDYYRVGWCSSIIQASYMDKIKNENDNFYFIGRYDAPASLLGTVYLIHEVTNSEQSSRRAWIYNSGQRRVRRAPNLAYDNVADGSEGMTTIDDAGGFNGSIDRYDWTLLGKKELYIPYNAYRLSNSKLKYSEIIEDAQVKSDLLRFELHRVWVVEAKLKSGMSHAYHRRIFYIDEDSWKIALSEAYDSRGELWRTALHPLIQLYDVPVMIARAGMYYDFISGSMLLNGLDNERKQPSMKWHVKGRLSDFSTSALRK